MGGPRFEPVDSIMVVYDVDRTQLNSPQSMGKGADVWTSEEDLSAGLLSKAALGEPVPKDVPYFLVFHRVLEDAYIEYHAAQRKANMYSLTVVVVLLNIANVLRHMFSREPLAADLCEHSNCEWVSLGVSTISLCLWLSSSSPIAKHRTALHWSIVALTLGIFVTLARAHRVLPPVEELNRANHGIAVISSICSFPMAAAIFFAVPFWITSFGSVVLFVSADEFTMEVLGFGVLQIVLLYAVDYHQRKAFLRDVENAEMKGRLRQCSRQLSAVELEESLSCSTSIQHSNDDSSPPSSSVDSLIPTSNSLVDSMVAPYRKLVRTTAHDLRTPISALKSGMHVLEKKYAKNDPVMLQILEIMQAALKMNLNYVDTMAISVSFLDGRKIAIRQDSIVLNDLLQECVKCAQLSCSTRSIDVSIDDRIGEKIRQDRQCLFRNLMSLISNAVNHSIGSIRVEVNLCDDRSNIEFVVYDSGPGVPNEIRESIWSPFFSMSSHETGLGLFVLSQQTRALGGTSGHRSGENGGSAFWFRVPHNQIGLPSVHLADRPLSDIEYAAAVRQKAPSVLLIDDTLTVLELHALDLEGCSCRVDTACDAEVGLAMMKAKSYDLVLCDYKMPGKNGALVTREFRAWEESQDREHKQNIYGLTAYQSEEILVECTTAGMQGILQKPMHVPTVLKLLACDYQDH